MRYARARASIMAATYGLKRRQAWGRLSRRLLNMCDMKSQPAFEARVWPRYWPLLASAGDGSGGLGQRA